MTTTASRGLTTPYVLASFAAIAIGLQVFSCVFAYRHADIIHRMLSSLNVEAPGVTALFLDTYRMWPAIPVLCALLAIHALRRGSRAYALSVVGVSVLGALVLKGWMNEALSAPLMLMMEKVANP